MPIYMGMPVVKAPFLVFPLKIPTHPPTLPSTIVAYYTSLLAHHSLNSIHGLTLLYTANFLSW